MVENYKQEPIFDSVEELRLSNEASRLAQLLGFKKTRTSVSVYF